MTPGKLDTIKPTSSATSLTEGDCFERTVVAFVTNFVAFSRKVITCYGSKTDFSWFKMKPRSVKSLVVKTPGRPSAADASENDAKSYTP